MYIAGHRRATEKNKAAVEAAIKMGGGMLPQSASLVEIGVSAPRDDTGRSKVEEVGGNCLMQQTDNNNSSSDDDSEFEFTWTDNTHHNHILIGCEATGPNTGAESGTPVDISKMAEKETTTSIDNNYNNANGYCYNVSATRKTMNDDNDSSEDGTLGTPRLDSPSSSTTKLIDSNN